RAVADEARHSEVCAAVGERYTGERRELPAAGVGPLVRFGNTAADFTLLLHLVLLSCVNEVVSTFYLRACMHRSRSELARAATRELLSDDVQHARIGWTHLASSNVTKKGKLHVASALPTLLRLSHEAWTSVPERAEPWFAD